MTIRIAISALLSVALAAAAQAQSFEGTYRGTAQLIRELVYLFGGDTCGRGGGPVAFQVKDSVITTRSQRAGLTFSAPVAGNGTFNITGSYSAGPGERSVTLEWKGTISGPRLTGTYVGYGAGSDCYFSFVATKQGRR